MMNAQTDKVGRTQDTAQKNPKENTLGEAIMTPAEFAQLGDGMVAYIKELRPGEVVKLFPEAEDVPQDIQLYSLHAADGTPLVLTDSRNAAIANALEIDLEPVPVQ